jgi:NAD(P)-dependent dehydrogenase (short-subunit alcohol dehydrogenase family)
VAALPVERDLAVLEYLRTTRELVAAQRDVLLGYLGTSGENLPALGSIGAGAPPAVAARPAVVAVSSVNTVTPIPTPVPSGPLTRTQVLDAVLAIVSHRTGYPSDMLDPGLDLEADLSIDSIKRTEILGELAERVGLAGADGAAIDESMVEELARLKTLNAIADWVVAHVNPAVSATGRDQPIPDEPNGHAGPLGGRDRPVPAGPNGHAGPLGGRDRAIPDEPNGHAGPLGGRDRPVPAGFTGPGPLLTSPAPAATRSYPARQVVELESLPLLPDPVDGDALLTGVRYVIVDGGLGIGLELSELLEQRGAEVVLLDAEQAESGNEDSLAAIDGAYALFHLAAIDPDQPSVLPRAFSVLREAAERGVARLIVATGGGGRFGFDRGPDAADAGLGLGGLVRTMRAEYPDLVSQLVDVDPKERAGAVASALLAELRAVMPPVAVGFARGTRTALRVTTLELDRAVTTSGRDIAESAAALGLGPDSVVLLTGGARGITSKVAIELARATGCHIELMGRTQAPVGEEDPATATAVDAPAIRRALIESGTRVPGQIEVATARLLATREIRATLDQLSQAAASARYHVVDVRNCEAVRSVVADIYARHGRLDGVIHGAGVLEDKRMSDKGVESFERVFRTKVDGARYLVSALRPDLGFLVLFASVAGVFGNRGQADYAAANDALDSLARRWSGEFQGRVVAVDWGPWAGAGMVSAELEREYGRRGVGLINVDDGVACLLRELAWGPPDVSQVVYLSPPVAGG